ncbi:MAG: hypothetical protein RBQ99_00870 [Trichlorobacter sp.]|jgi:hypothetical protein|nr:hypothetical protein [Trichlorobacter sp.]
MDIFKQLEQMTIQAQNENELPDFLSERIFRIISEADRYSAFSDDIIELTYQVEHYDTYGQTGYIGMGVNNVILEATIRRLEAKTNSTLNT